MRFSDWKSASLFSVLTIPMLLLTHSLYAAECAPWQDTFKNKDNLIVGVITINNQNVFNLKNPKEQAFGHRLANKIHIKTKPRVIKNQLLFQTGDKFQHFKLAETERKLRAQRYIKDANVEAFEVCGNKVNIHIKTSDNWSLTPSLSASRAGGNNRSGIKIQEHNLFGLGKSLSLSYKKGVERSSKLLAYEDHQLFGSHKTLVLGYQNNSDGKGYDVNLNQPYFELESKSSWGISAHNLKQENTLYDKAETSNKITTREKNYSIFYGWSAKHQKDSVTRFKVGWAFNKTKYLKADNPIGSLPFAIQESYPWFEYTQLDEKYIKKINFKTMGKIEDVALGKRLSIGLGLLLKDFSSDSNQLKLSSKYSKGFELNSHLLGFISLDASTYLGRGNLQGETISIKGEIDHFKPSGNDIRLATSFQFSNNQKPHKQLFLGGDSGLRGYPHAFQTGNKLALVQAEKRFHFNWYPFHLAKFGAVAFADAGTVWGNGNKAKLLANIGVGLRMIPTRSSSSKTLHLDLAVPLTDKANTDSVYFVIKTSQSF